MSLDISSWLLAVSTFADETRLGHGCQHRQGTRENIMKSRLGIFCVAAALMLLFDVSSLLSLELKGRAVAIYVDDMHCKNCAKKIARKLYAVPGVIAVHANVKQNLALITPQQGKDPSRRALWEAIEAAKFKPVKLIGPEGTYKTKPSN